MAASARREIQKRIERKRREVGDLEKRIHEARIYIQALEDTLKLLPRDGVNSGSADSVLRPNSSVAKARQAILNAGKALHINEILSLMDRDPGKKTDRAAVSGALGAYVRRGEIFTRPAPNTFGLIESEAGFADEEPPDYFGATDSATNSETPDDDGTLS